MFEENNVIPLVFPLPATRGGNTCGIRILNADPTGFDAACVEPGSWDGFHIAMTMHYVAVEPGVHTVNTCSGGTFTMAAGSVDSDQVFPNSVTAVFGTTFQNPPAVLLQIQTVNSEATVGAGTPPGKPQTLS